MAHLTVNVVTPGKDLLHAEVEQVQAPSVLGEVGILVDHLPLLANMGEGPLALRQGGDWHWYAISGGFLEVDRNTVTILAETAEKAADIDVKRSERALKDAEKKLQTMSAWDDEYEEQQSRIRRAQTRLLVAAHAKH